MPIVIADLDYVLAITVVKQVLGQFAPYLDLYGHVLFVKKARLIVHLLLRPVLLLVLQHLFNDFLDLFSALSLALPGRKVGLLGVVRDERWNREGTAIVCLVKW